MTTITAPALLPVETAPLEQVGFDLYRDIHKGIRNELFGLTYAAGNVDPSDRDAVAAVGSRFRDLVHFLISHAEHEDTHVQPLIEKYAPVLAAQIEADHPALEAKLARLELLAEQAVDAARVSRRLASHRFYLGMASFTADYLQHQTVEEADVMPALAAVLSFDELLAVNIAIVSSVGPEDMAKSAQLMLPAMNIDDRTEMVGGMKATMPPEVFGGVWQLVESALTPSDFQALARRLG